MALSLFSSSLLEGLRRDRLHDKDLDSALAGLRSRCDDEGIPFAVIGALAMRQHGYVRHTEDIDIVTTREGLLLIHERLVGRGLRPRAEGLRKKLRDTVHNVDIDVIQAGEHAGSVLSPVVYPDPASDSFSRRDDAGIAYATLPALVTFKLGYGFWGSRTRDLADVEELIKANGLDESFAESQPEALRPAYLERLAASRRALDIE